MLKDLESLFKDLTPSNKNSPNYRKSRKNSTRGISNHVKISRGRYFQEMANGAMNVSPNISTKFSKKKEKEGALPNLSRKMKFRISGSVDTSRLSGRFYAKNGEDRKVRERRKERINLSFVKAEDIKLDESKDKRQNRKKSRKRKSKSRAMFDSVDSSNRYPAGNGSVIRNSTGRERHKQVYSAMGERKNSSPSRLKQNYPKNSFEKIRLDIKINQTEPPEEIEKLDVRMGGHESPFKMMSRREILNQLNNSTDEREFKLTELRNRVESKLQMMRDRRRQELDKLPSKPNQVSYIHIRSTIEAKPWIPLGFLTKLTHDQVERNYPPVINSYFDISNFKEKELLLLLKEISLAEKLGKRLLTNDTKNKELYEIEMNIKYFNKGRELFLKKIKEKSHYEKLGIKINCSDSELKKSFRILVRKFG